MDTAPIQVELHSANELATIRTALALDRTLLAWIRTSLTLIGFGFALARYLSHLISEDHLVCLNNVHPREVGAGLMALGVATLLGGAMEYARMARRLRPQASIWSVSLVVSLVLAVVALALIVDLLITASSH